MSSFIEVLCFACIQVWYPLLRLREAGHEPFTIGPEQGKCYNSKHGYPCKADCGIDQVSHEVISAADLMHYNCDDLNFVSCYLM